MKGAKRSGGQDLAGFAISVMRLQNSIKSQHNISLVVLSSILLSGPLFPESGELNSAR